MGLTARTLTLVLGGRTVLRDVSVAFAPGRVTVVLGANGAGKTSLLRALAGLVPARGLTLDGQDIAALSSRARARAIGYLPQDAAVHWNMRVGDLVALGRLPHGGRSGGSGAVAAALAATDTARFVDRPVRSLSGGERARVLLARVLAGEPRWLLADEPLASLDPLHQLQTLRLLRAAADGGMGVVVVVHDLTLAARIADDALLLQRGTVLAHGPAADVLREDRLATAYGLPIAILTGAQGRAILPLDPA